MHEGSVIEMDCEQATLEITKKRNSCGYDGFLLDLIRILSLQTTHISLEHIDRKDNYLTHCLTKYYFCHIEEMWITNVPDCLKYLYLTYLNHINRQ